MMRAASTFIQAAALTVLFGGIVHAQTPATSPPGAKPTTGADVPFDPGYYVRIYEETRGKRILLYDPAEVHRAPTLLRADADSKIVVQLDDQKLGFDMALNGLVMTAELSRVETSTSPVKVEVLNYSEVATDPKTQASQAGVALRTAGEVLVLMRNLYQLTKELVGELYQPECSNRPTGSSRPAGCTYERHANFPDTAARNARLRDSLRAFQPRIDVITDFFSSDRNALVVSEIGQHVFGLDLRSVKAMSAKLKQDVALVVKSDPGRDSERASDDILRVLVNLWDDMQQLRAETDVAGYFRTQWQTVVQPHFLQILAPGIIDLRRYKAADGETLTLTVQARGAGGEGAGGVSRDFHIAIKRLRPRLITEPSAFYLRRLGEVRDATGKSVSTNFAPAPGVTFGPVFYSRGVEQVERRVRDAATGRERTEREWRARDSKRDQFWSALAPGFGMNVSFMNFAVVNDFDPTVRNAAGQVVGGFRTTTSGSVQVGAGVTVSLFANALQATYGVNLNVDEKRSYWGIGFGFLQIGQELAKVVKK